jgi:geranylgeranyl diphosphate synthase, type I
MLLANIPAPADVRMKMVSIMNRTMLTTAHGQTLDIMHEAAGEASEESIEQVMEWKTAHYSILNPLHVGMVLAGADCAATDAITPYAVHTGKAFQITDDIIGTFGSEEQSGKSPFDDIREGKQTLLTAYALKNAPTADKNFLLQMLGNESLTPAEFTRCRDILRESGALKYARQQARRHIAQALASLNNESSRWNAEGVHFLRGLASYLLERQA